MGYAVTILTKEEALRLPPKERPLCYRLPEALFNRIHSEIGAATSASPEEAARIAFDLCHFVADFIPSPLVDEVRIKDPQPTWRKCETCQNEATVHIEVIGCHFCASCLTKIDARIAEMNRPEQRAERLPPAENGGN